MSPLLRRISQSVDWRSLWLGLAVLAPLIFVACWTNDRDWWHAMIITVSVFIAADRSALAPLGVIMHAIAIALGFLFLLMALASPTLFVPAVVLLASASVLITAYGSEYRSLGNWTFIPSLYLACEIAQRAAPDAPLMLGLHFLPYAAAAIAPVLLLSLILHSVAWPSGVGAFSHFGQLLHKKPLAGRQWVGKALLATALAVACAAAVVEWQRLPHGQWMIWSAVSVIAGEATTNRRKLQDRAIGALVGVPLGFGLGVLLPHSSLTYSITAVLTLVTLMALRHYTIAFGLRCACVVLALVITGQTNMDAADRVIHVLVGGVIGILSFSLVQAFTSRAASHHDQGQPVEPS
jgi:hypothetical protein